jgi:hypothetical protein
MLLTHLVGFPDKPVIDTDADPGDAAIPERDMAGRVVVLNGPWLLRAGSAPC